jgi:hypothetical protein
MKMVILIVTATLLWTGMNQAAFGGETSLAAYATYWEGNDEGIGGGLKLRQKFLGFFSADIRAGYVDFDDVDTSVVPLEATLMAGIPFVLEPYVGIGAGYYIVDSDRDWLDSDIAGYYGLAGLQLNMFVVGLMGEIRYNDAEGSYFDGPSVNLGLMVKW